MKNVSKIMLAGLILIAGIKPTPAKAIFTEIIGAGVVSGIASTSYLLANENFELAAKKILLSQVLVVLTTAGSVGGFYAIEKLNKKFNLHNDLIDFLLFFSTCFGIPISTGFLIGSSGITGCAFISEACKNGTKN